MFGAIRAADPSRPAPQKDMLSLENDELFRDELVRAGFSEVSVTPHEAGFEVSNSDDLWERMARSSAPLVLLRRRIGEEAWATQGAIARRYLNEQLGGRSVRLTTKAFLGSGRKPA
jgi:hypothetical protein